MRLLPPNKLHGRIDLCIDFLKLFCQVDVEVETFHVT